MRKKKEIVEEEEENASIEVNTDKFFKDIVDDINFHDPSLP